MSPRNVLVKPQYSVIKRFDEDGMTYFCESKSHRWNVYWKASNQETVTVFDEESITTIVIPVTTLHKYIKENFLK